MTEVFCPECRFKQPGDHKCVLSVPETEARDLSRFIEEGMRRLESESVNELSGESRITGEL